LAVGLSPSFHLFSFIFGDVRTQLCLIYSEKCFVSFDRTLLILVVPGTRMEYGSTLSGPPVGLLGASLHRVKFYVCRVLSSGFLRPFLNPFPPPDAFSKRPFFDTFMSPSSPFIALDSPRRSPLWRSSISRFPSYRHGPFPAVVLETYLFFRSDQLGSFFFFFFFSFYFPGLRSRP